MSTSWTADQITALAPDAASAKAGAGLAQVRQWVSLGATEEVVWGECKGSGKNPYQTQISIAEPSFKCSCPSRKFPCKHGLGLLLLRASGNGVWDAAPPTWVEEWLQGRAKRAEAQTQRAVRKEAEPVDVAAQAKRAEKREGRVAAGIAELELWLRDAMRRGLADLPRDYAFWDAPAARLTDAQASGLARMLRETGAVAVSSGAHDVVLERLAKLHLLVEGWRRREVLTPMQIVDVRTAIGWTPDAAELARETGVRDEWLVAGSRITEEEKLRVCRTWLWGRNSGQPALILQFAHGNAPFDATPCGGSALVPGTVLDAELTFYPSSTPLRATVRERFTSPQQATELPSFSVEESLHSFASILSQNPWIETWPFALREVHLVQNGENWAVRDSINEVPVKRGFAESWRLMALSAGRPFTICGEWDGNALAPFSAYANGRWMVLA